MASSPLPRLRRICLALPEAHEVIAWGTPTFRVRNKLFAMYAHADDHHGAGRNAIWCKSTHITQDLLLRAQPERYFSPPYVGKGGWVGVVLDGSVDWEGVADLLSDAYRLTAPKRLRLQLDQPPPPRTPSRSKRARTSKAK
jgi:predicted DNA-binding protein (MmcQ/YjbR family)